MSDRMHRLNKETGEQSSRRSFMVTMGKVVAGLAAVISGENFIAGNAFAHGEQSSSYASPDVSPDVFLYCCTGVTCNTTYGTCPSNTHVGYQWTCCYGSGTQAKIICNDCYNSSNQIVCTWAYYRNGYNC